jgi:protein-glucosylgalactosylhydroxylysine glucosidase
MSGPISPDPVRTWHPDHLPVYVSNGLLGLRFEAVPFAGVATVNGFVGPDPREEVESLLPVPYPLAGDVVVEGTPISAVPTGELLREQCYDFARGEVRTAMAFTTGGWPSPPVACTRTSTSSPCATGRFPRSPCRR